MLVLFAEDEHDLAELTIDYLETESIECDYASDGVMAINLLSENTYDVVLLDVSMPRSDGFSVCRWMKSEGIHTPVIFLTAKDSLEDKLAGFELGADDYLTKPFELDELVARLQVLSRRSEKVSRIFKLNNLTVNLDSHQVFRDEFEIILAPTQWQLISLLAKNSPNVVSKVDIEKNIWPDQDVNKDMFKTLVFRLRNAIDKDQNVQLIHTVRGAGIALRTDENE